MSETTPEITHLADLMATLRSPDGCPWDREQTHQTLKPYALEETYELLEAIDEQDSLRLCEELGDLLLQVVFHAQIASEEERFDLGDVIQAISDKLVRRHPHVFGEETISTAEEVRTRWEAIKRTEGKPRMADIPRNLPALMRAQHLGEQAARAGFDWSGPQPVRDKLTEELDEVDDAMEHHPDRVFEELGDLLFTVVNLARHLTLDAEQALRAASDRFEQRFLWVERLANEEGRDLRDCDAEELDTLWERAKQGEDHQSIRSR